MPRPVIPEIDIQRIRRYCAGRVPPQYADQIRIEADVRGRSVTIRECRPPWRPEWGPEWTRRPVAQLRYDDATGQWRLFAANRNGRWLVYPSRPGRVARLLDEIEADPIAIFWG